jgi:foldase protein PrsA
MDEKEKKELEATNELDNHEEGKVQEEQPTVTEHEVVDQEDTQENTQDVNHVMERQASEPLHSNTSGEGSKPNNKIWPIISLVLAVLLVVALFKSPFAKSSNEAVATVDGVEITKDMLYDELLKSGGEAALNNLINQKMVDQAAKQQKVTVTQADIDERIKEMVTQYGSQENLDQALQQYGMTMDNLKENLMVNLKVTKLINPEVTDKEVSDTFEQYKEQFNTPEQVRTSEILVKTEDEAKAIIKELEGGKDFAELAKEKSLDTATKEKGGDTDFYAKGQKEEAIANAAFKLAKDEVSAPVKTEQGYVVIKLTDRKEAHTATLDEKKDEIKRTLIGQKVSEKQAAWLEDLKAKMKVENKLYPEKKDTSESAVTNTNKK